MKAIIIFLSYITISVVSSHEGVCTIHNDGSTSCHVEDDYWNNDMNAYNIKEIDVPIDVIKEIHHEYQQNIQPHLRSGNSTDDFCLVSPYQEGVSTWGSFVNEQRSDIQWWSVNTPETFEYYMNYVKRLGLVEEAKTLMQAESDDDLTVYSIFFIPRSFSKSLEFHEDWSEEVGTGVITFLVPLNDFNIGLAYKDEDNEVQQYKYRLGKAVAVGGGLLHSTGVGQAEEGEQDVLLCVYVGARDPEIWWYAQVNIDDELEHYNHPFKGFIRNERLSDRPSKCQRRISETTE